MTHKLKTCLLILLVIMISTWGAILQASQNKHGFMTDGNNFIYNQVISGGTVETFATDYTANGTIGQAILNIGVASSENETLSPSVITTQKAGFWHAIQISEEKLLSFTEAEVVQVDESDDSSIKLKLALNQSANPITVTISTSLSSNCNADDYTLYINGTAQNATSVNIVVDELVNEELSVKIKNDRLIEENDETITFNIENIEGDPLVKLGPFPRFVINIPANDAWAITGTVKYLGSQTGVLNVEAKDTTSGEPIVDPKTCEWETDTVSKTFTTKVPPGTYTICSYIDSKGVLIEEENSWEVTGAYTYTVSIRDDGSAVVNGGEVDLDEFSFNFAMYDPDDRYETQFIKYTGTYKTWIENYPDVLNATECGDPDEDYDKDGYTNFQEYLNGTDPTSVDEPYVYNGYDPAFDDDTDDVSNKYQIVTTNPLFPKARFGESFLVDINYTTSDDNRGTTGLGLAIHYNSTFLTFAGWSNVLTETLAGSYEDLTTTVKDEEDVDTPDDNYEDTDKVITIAWIPRNKGDRNWPGLEVPLPLRLCTLKFSVKSEAEGITYGDTSVLRFSATSKDTRYTFYGSPTTVEMDPFSFDVDGNGKANALTDGLLIMRYLFGLIIYNTNLQEDAVAADAIRTSSAEIWTYLNNGFEMLDVDRDGTSDALTDGLLIMRYMFGFTEGDALIENAIAPGAANDTDEKVIPYIKHYMPQKGSNIITPTTD